MIKHSQSLLKVAIRGFPNNISCRGFARTRREAPRNVKSEPAVLVTPASTDGHSAPTDPTQIAFISKANKIIKDMSSKSSSTFIKEGQVEENNSWNWVPPRDGERVDDEVIPVIEGVLLTAEEIKAGLIAQGGMDVVIVEMMEPLDTITHLVLTTGRSTRHIRKLSDSIVQALRSRKLKQAMGRKGAEGEKDDDWLCVDCFDIVVHFMLPNTRKALDLETHWTTKRPVLHYSENEKIYDENFERILDLYPIPDDYQVPVADEKVEVSKKQKVTVRRL